MTNDTNYEHCKAIADDLENVVSGDYFVHEGKLFPLDTDDFSEVKGCHYDEENAMYIMADGEEICEGDVYPVDIFEWLGDDIYDVEYTIGGDKEYRGVKLMKTALCTIHSMKNFSSAIGNVKFRLTLANIRAYQKLTILRSV